MAGLNVVQQAVPLPAACQGVAQVFAVKVHRLRGGVGVGQRFFQRGGSGGDAQHPAAVGDQLAVHQLIAGVV